MNADPVKLLRGGVGIVVLAALVVVVLNFYGDFRDARKAPATGETTRSVTPTTSVSPSPKSSTTPSSPAKTQQGSTTKMVEVLIDGLNFREKPASDGKPIRGLSAGDRLVLVETQGSWYRVRDNQGTEGWVNSNPQYTKLVEN